MFFKNVAGQKIPAIVVSKLTGLPVSGYAGTLSCRIDRDGANSYAALANNVAVEGEGGVCYFSPSQAETNGDMLSCVFASSNSSVAVAPLVIFTDGGVNVGVDDGTYSKMGNAGTDTGQPRGKDTDSLSDVAAAVQARMDSASTQFAALSTAIAAIQGTGFSTDTDSLEAIRDRGDVAWITGGGGAAPTVAQIRAEIDANSTQLAAILLNIATAIDGIAANNSLIDALGSVLAAIRGAGFDGGTDSLEAIRNALRSNDGEELAEVLAGLASMEYGPSEYDEGTGEMVFKSQDGQKERIRGYADEHGARSEITKDLS